jgi:hypothetical protein
MQRKEHGPTECEVYNDAVRAKMSCKITIGVRKIGRRDTLRENGKRFKVGLKSKLRTHVSVSTDEPPLTTSEGTALSPFDQNQILMNDGVRSMAYLNRRCETIRRKNKLQYQPPPLLLNGGPKLEFSSYNTPQPELELAYASQSFWVAVLLNEDKLELSEGSADALPGLTPLGWHSAPFRFHPALNY